MEDWLCNVDINNVKESNLNRGGTLINLKIFVNLFGILTKISGYYVKLGHMCFVSHILQSIFKIQVRRSVTAWANTLGKLCVER